MTQKKCAEYCTTEGYRYAGVENGDKCYCGDYILNSGLTSKGKLAPTSKGCTKACAGNSKEKCGGTTAIQIYEDMDYIQTSKTLLSHQDWTFTDCFVDTVDPRSLPDTLSVTSKTMTIAKCLAACKAKGYKYCAAEGGGQCYGAKSKLSTKVKVAPSMGNSDPIARGCSTPCNGNAKEICGGTGRLSLYTYS